MPTKNPRINLTLTPERYELLKRLAGYQGSTMAGLVSETMEMMYPVMERVCVVLEAAKRAQETSKEGFRDSIAKAEAEMLPLMYQAVDQFDMFVDEAARSLGVEFDTQETTSQVISRAMKGAEKADESLPTGGGRRPIPHTENPRVVIRGPGSEKATKSTTRRSPKK